jgi:bis(5'-nucleosyl)-tetraphosphatase (symmetrical)
MSTYCIGDVQGCFDQLQQLLQKIQFDSARDRLWFTGDLVNRGPKSLDVLRFIKNLGDRAIVVLGNHDLHLLAVAYGHATQHKQDTLQEILLAPDKDKLCNWLRQQPLLHHDAVLGFTLVHAGLAPQWNLNAAQQHAHEVETVLRGNNYQDFFAHLYGNQPACWDEKLSGWDRLRIITNYFTRLRFCKPDGTLELQTKGESHTPPPEFLPWFKIPNRKNKDLKIIFGHWAALAGKTDESNVHALDTGCVWGHCLTTLCLETGERFSIECKE